MYIILKNTLVESYLRDFSVSFQIEFSCKGHSSTVCYGLVLLIFNSEQLFQCLWFSVVSIAGEVHQESLL